MGINKNNNIMGKDLHKEIMEVIETADLQSYVVIEVLNAVKSDVLSEDRDEG